MWRVIAAEFAQVSCLRRDVRAHLASLIEPEADLGGAELVVSELLTNAVEHGSGPVSFDLDWTGEHPIVTVHDVGRGFDTLPDEPADSDQTVGRGLAIARTIALDVSVEAGPTGSIVRATLDLRRADAGRAAVCRAPVDPALQ